VVLQRARRRELYTAARECRRVGVRVRWAAERPAPGGHDHHDDYNRPHDKDNGGSEPEFESERLDSQTVGSGDGSNGDPSFRGEPHLDDLAHGVGTGLAAERPVNKDHDGFVQRREPFFDNGYEDYERAPDRDCDALSAASGARGDSWCG
jgi:hypothetical protein